MKKIGIITFHNSYNCGSMLESYAIQHWLNKNGYNAEIIDYASEGQKNLYAVFEKHLSLRSIVKNLILMPHYRRLKNNNKEYEKFKNTFYKKSKPISSRTELESTNYDILVAGSDQIWNTTIADFDYAYYLDFSKTAKNISAHAIPRYTAIKSNLISWQACLGILITIQSAKKTDKSGSKKNLISMQRFYWTQHSYWMFPITKN